MSETKRRVSYDQLITLWKFLNANRDVAMGYNKSTLARSHSRMMWTRVTHSLNSFRDGSIKDWRGWSTYWVDYKAKLKKKIAAARTAQSEADDNLSEAVHLSEVEQQFALILDKSEGLGLHNGKHEPCSRLFAPDSSGAASPTTLPEFIDVTSAVHLDGHGIGDEEESEHDEKSEKILLLVGGDQAVSNATEAKVVTVEVAPTTSTHDTAGPRRLRRSHVLYSQDPTRRSGAESAATRRRNEIAARNSNTLASILNALNKMVQIFEKSSERPPSPTTPTPTPDAANSERVGFNETLESPYQRDAKQNLFETSFTPGRSCDVVPENQSIAITVDPPRDMRSDEAEYIKKSLGQSIVQAIEQDEEFIPKLRGFPQLIDGALFMWCDTAPSVDWVRIQADKLKLPMSPGSNLKVVLQSEKLTRIRAALFVPDYEGHVGKLQKILMRQNPEYEMAKWSLYRATPSQRETKGMFLVLGIPPEEVVKLMARERRCAYSIGSVYVRFFVDGSLQDTPPELLIQSPVSSGPVSTAVTNPSREQDDEDEALLQGFRGFANSVEGSNTETWQIST